MAAKRVTCGLVINFAGDLQNEIVGACGEGYDFICTDILDPKCKTMFQHSKNGNRLGDDSSVEFMLKSQDWCNLVVGKVTSLPALEGGLDFEKAEAEKATCSELDFAAYLSLPSVLLTLESYQCSNLARLLYSHLLNSHHSMMIWVHVPIDKTGICNGRLGETTWHWWNKLRNLCNNHSRIGVAVEITANLPDELTLKQWLGEPVKLIVLNTSVFLSNGKGYPVLSKAHQTFVMQLYRLNCQVLITGNNTYPGMRVYQQYMYYLFDKRPPLDQYEQFARGYEDYLQSPLQPLMDNLESATYEVFEKDPVKYQNYQDAIKQCLLDRVSQFQANSTVVVVMVLGAGRGPLVRAALKAAELSERKIKCYAVEKNANASVTLQLLKRTEWIGKDVTIVSCDMRLWEAPQKADIIVSELLGSFGDNELSPECLDGAERFLKPDAVSIPGSYTSYMSPISSQKLYNEVTNVANLDRDKPKITAFETPYVVRLHNYHELAKAKSVFNFCHPKKNEENKKSPYNTLSSCDTLINSRHKSLSFDIPCNTLLHGFAGYFFCTLYKDVNISIVPDTHSKGMFSWFPIFFPLVSPLNIKKGDKVEFEIWRKCSREKVWYEWAVTEPSTTVIMNPGGRSYTIGL